MKKVMFPCYVPMERLEQEQLQWELQKYMEHLELGVVAGARGSSRR